MSCNQIQKKLTPKCVCLSYSSITHYCILRQTHSIQAGSLFWNCTCVLWNL